MLARLVAWSSTSSIFSGIRKAFLKNNSLSVKGLRLVNANWPNFKLLLSSTRKPWASLIEQIAYGALLEMGLHDIWANYDLEGASHLLRRPCDHSHCNSSCVRTDAENEIGEFTWRFKHAMTSIHFIQTEPSSDRKLYSERTAPSLNGTFCFI
jgi:hypothetical protein